MADMTKHSKTLCVIFTAYLVTTTFTNALTKLNLAVTCDSGINIVFGQENTLTCDLSVSPDGSDLTEVGDLIFTTFLSSGGSGALTDETKTTETTEITPTAPQGALTLANGEATDITDVPVTLDFSGQPGCYDDGGYESPYIIMCILVDKAVAATTPVVIPDTVCLELNTCKHIITVADTGKPTLATNAGNDLEVIYGTDKSFTLDITIAPDDETKTATFQGAANELFSVEVYLSADDEVTDATTAVPATVPTDVVSVVPDTNIVLTGVTADLSDLSGLNCDNQTHVCAKVSPKDGSAWQWGSGGINPKIACAQVTCKSEIEADPAPTVMTNENGDLDVVMGSTESFDLDVTLTTGHGTAQIDDTASELFDAQVYLANDALGQNPQDPKTAATVTSTSIVIEPDVGVDEEPVVINVVANSVDLDNLNCDAYHYVCVDLTSHDTSIWTWKDGDTTAKTACVEIISCKGQIDGTTSIDKNDAASEDLVVVMGPQRAFHLDVEVAVTADSDSATVDAVGTNMFDIKVYLASDDQGSGSSEHVNATNLPATDVTLSESSSATLSNVQATLDLDGFACEDFSHVCALIVPKDYSPSEPWIWVDSSASDTACVAIAISTACSIQVTEETITVVATDGTNLDIQMGSTKDFSLDITLVTGDNTGELSLQADEMFSVKLYLAADVNGSNPSTKAPATLPADSVTIDNRTTTGPVTATVSGYELADLSCASYTHVCVDVAPIDSKWAWTSEDDVKTACVALGICTSVITGSLSAEASDTVVRMGTNKLFNLDVTIAVSATSAVVTGPEASLYHIQVFLALDDDGTNPSAKYNATITSSEAGATMSVASPDTVVSDVTVQINLEGQSCEDFQYVCVEVKPHHTATWSWNDVGTSAKLACDTTVIDCSSEIRADSVTLNSNQAGDLDVIMGGSEDFRLDITIETGAETAKIEGNDDELFAVNVYLATGNGQSGGAESAREAATVQSDATIINPSSTITISDVTLTGFDLLGKGCDDYSYVCVDVSPATGAEWLWSTAALINACVQIADCSAILRASSLALSGTSGSIVVAMGAPQTFVLDVTITTEADNTGKVTGTLDQLFTVDVYLATDNAGTDNTEKVSAVLPSSAFTVKDSDVQAITGIQATVDLSQSECDSYSHVCADVTTLSADVWEWYGTLPGPTCVAYTDCTTAPTIATTVANNNAGTLAVIMGESKTFHLDVTATLSLGDAISGENLYSVSAYLATDQQGSNPKPSNKVVGTITDNDIGFSDVSPATLTDVTATMDFSDLITCQQSANQNYGYVCVDLSENPAAVPTWSATASSSMTGCVALSPPCQSQPLLDFTLSGLQIISPSNKKVIVGENVEVVFDVTVQLDANSGSANGNDNWEIEGFLSTSATGAVKTAKVPATAASMASHIGHDMDGGDSYTFEDVVVDLPLGPTDCGDLGYFCVELSQGGAADWYFDPFNPSTNVACTAVTCTTAGDATVQTMSLSLGIVSLLVTVWINL